MRIVRSVVSTIAILLASLCVAGGVYAQPGAALSSAGAQGQEIGLGDLTADALRAASGAQIAFVPAGSFKDAAVPSDRVRYADANSFLQYPADLVTVIQITGSQIIKALERSVSLYPQKNLGFLQISGLSFTYSPKAQRGSRVASVMINAKTKLDPGAKYTVAMTRPFANGAYGYFIIWGKGKDKISDTGRTILQAVSEYITKADLPEYAELGRISQAK